MPSNRRKRMANRFQQPTQVNGLYVHASPPRVVQMNPSIMRQWLRGGDLDKLEQVVLEGQGSRLVGEYSGDPKTRAFIRSVPSLLSKIEAAHSATSRGQLKELQDLIAGEKRIQLALAKDRSGVGLLHKAVFNDHGNIIEWLIQAHPATVNSKDREGRSPLHYCGAGSDAQYTWRTLIEAGADPQQADVRGRVPAYYMDNPDDLRLPASPADSEEIRRITAARECLIVKPSNIRIWIHDQDLGRLKQVLWEGHGNRLRTETSKYPAVKRFLEFVPYAMSAIRDTHAAAISGDMEAFRKRTAEPAPVDLIVSKDSNGLTPLHKSAGLGNVGVTDEILRRAPRATVVADNFGRTPLHYSVLLKDQGEMYNTLIREGADELAVDNLGRTAEYYRGRPGDLDPSLLRNIPEAPRTSSVFPPSWDWNVMATDGLISNQTSGASRRPRKTPRTSGATRSDDGGSPLDEAPSTNGPVNGQAEQASDEDRPKTSDNKVITTEDIKPPDNAEEYPTSNGRLDSQTSSAADGEETAGRLEEQSQEKSDDGKSTLEEPPQTGDGDCEPPSGQPDETPIRRTQSQLDGNKLDDDVPPTTTDAGEPTNNTDAGSNGSGDAKQSTESNNVDSEQSPDSNNPDAEQSTESNNPDAEQPKSANETQETAAENVTSEKDPDVNDQVSENNETRDKRSVDNNTIDKNANTDNVAVPSTDNIPSAEDISADVDVPKPEDGSPPLDINGIQDNIVTSKISTDDIPTTDSISTTDNIPPTDGDLSEKINGSSEDFEEAIKSSVPNEDTNLPSTKDAIKSSVPNEDTNLPSTKDAIESSVPSEDTNVPSATDAIKSSVPNEYANFPSAEDAINSSVPNEDTNIPSTEDTITSSVPNADTNFPSKDTIDIPNVVIDPESADENQYDDPREDNTAAENSEPGGEVAVLSSDTKIPNGDVTRDEGKDGEDPSHPPKEVEEEASDETSNDTANQKVKDSDPKVDGGSNPAEEQRDTIKSGADAQPDNNNFENNNGDSTDLGDETGGKKNGIDSKREVNEDPKGDGDDNNNVGELDKEAPGTPDSVDVVSGDRSADENEEEDTNGRTNVGDPTSGGNNAHDFEGEAGLESITGNATAESTGMSAEDGPQSKADNPGEGVETLKNYEATDKTGNGEETNAQGGDSNGVADSEGPSDAVKEDLVEVTESVASPREIAPTEVSPGAPTTHEIAGSSIGHEDGSGVAPLEEGTSEAAPPEEESSGGVPPEEGSSGVAPPEDESSGAAPPEEGNPEVDPPEKRSPGVITEGGASAGLTSIADEAPQQDETEDSQQVSNGLSEQERKLEEGDNAKGEGLSNATTAIIGAQSSPDTINTDEFQESDSRLYRSSRRPQTPLPIASTVLTEEDEDEGVIGDEEEEPSGRRGLVNGDGARHLQGRVIGERNMDNQAAASNIVKGTIHGGTGGQGTTSRPPKSDPEVDRLIARGDLSALAELVLNGEGHRLVGRRSEMPELQSFIENVPMYMAKIQSVHDSARSGQLRELQAALDRRKFAVARDPRTPAGATPLHAAVLLGQTAVVRYLAGRFPETLAARDARGRSPLHCAAALPDNGHYFNLLLNLGADRTLKDNSGRTASYYMQNPGSLSHKQLLADINAPQSIADESFADKVPDDQVSSRRRVVNDPELANTMDKYFQVIEEAAVDARADNRPVCRMVVLKFLTRNVFDQCKYLLTRMDHGILNVIWPVILDQSRSVEDRLKQSGTFFEEAGIVLPDYESYSVFSVIVLPVIKYLNGLDPRQPILPHPPSRFFEDTEEDVSSSGTTVSVLSRMELRNDEAAQRSMDLDPSRKMILHSVAHCTRNLQDYNLPLTLTLDDLREVERCLRRALLTGKSPYETRESGQELDDLVLSDDEGTYYPLEELSDPLHDIRVKLRSAGQWLEQQGDPDRSMRLNGKYWPIGRGVFVTKDGNIAAYINVQDHLRVMVASKEGQAGKIGLVYRNLGEFMEKVDNIFQFKQDDILGHLAARPWVCGNTLRFKVTVRLPKLGREPEHLIALCKSRSLRLASAASLDVFHFSNRQCLGITEAQVYRSFVTAVANILQLEHRMEANGLHFTAIIGRIFRKRRVTANAVR